MGLPKNAELGVNLDAERLTQYVRSLVPVDQIMKSTSTVPANPKQVSPTTETKKKADETKKKADEEKQKVDEANKKAKKKEDEDDSDGYAETELTPENSKSEQILKNLTYDSDGKPLKDGHGVEQFGKYLISNHKKRTYLIKQKIKNGWRLQVNDVSPFHTYAEVTKATGHNDNTVFNHIGRGIRHNDYRISLWSKDLKFDDATYIAIHKKVMGRQ